MGKLPIVQIYREPQYKDLPLPGYATPGSSGVDLLAAIESTITIDSMKWRLVSSGIRIAVPEGYEGQIRPRSGLALKNGVSLLNSPGTIDSDYRGIVGVILVNFSDTGFTLNRGDRIAQLIIAPIAKLKYEEVSCLGVTTRGEGGFGSTGVGHAGRD